jgi:N-acetylglucosamine kinase-like BadF-type ATPase
LKYNKKDEACEHASTSGVFCGTHRFAFWEGIQVYYLGIDGGGTKTAFVLADEQNNIIKEGVGGPTNPVDVGMPMTLSRLGEGIDTLLEGVPHNAVSVFAGIAGGMTGDNRACIRDYLHTLGFAASDCGSDVQNVVAAGLGTSGGICIIMGTGSATFLQKDRELLRFGGYGYLFEDGGSGYALGRDAIRVALAAEEMGGEPTLIHDLLLTALQTPTVLSALSDFYSGGKTYVASFAPIVFEAYEQGDAVASRILRNNMACVAEELAKARQALKGDCPVRTVLAGGLTKQADVLLPMLKEQLDDAAMYEITILTEPPVMGAVALAKERYHDQNRNEK